jgi:hypothetical protein
VRDALELLGVTGGASGPTSAIGKSEPASEPETAAGANRLRRARHPCPPRARVWSMPVFVAQALT